MFCPSSILFFICLPSIALAKEGAHLRLVPLIGSVVYSQQSKPFIKPRHPTRLKASISIG
jgi:hypothetical protein